ncbi:MAG TPA: TetR/AcrR family transcriptional regulator [Acidimicrobiales bacterium]|nr:TetR/AcrR family transcriptional regulator [Acidimicrobiales bacterium]
MTPSSHVAKSGASGGGVEIEQSLPDLLPPEFALADLEGASEIDTSVTDGRVARGQRTRRNVAEALMSLLREGDAEPTARSVAERAGVSLRLVFHHFAEMDDLYHYVAALLLRRQWSGMPLISPKLALTTRLERTAAHRAALYEEISPVRRALVHRMSSSDGVGAAIHAADTLLLENLKETFAPELSALPASSRMEVLEAMDVVSSWEAWERLRTVSMLQVRGAKRVMTRMLEAQCAPQVSARRGAHIGAAAAVS